MKICTFTTVKDEEDIIESFVRYHLNIVDKMIISDNCSNDNTLNILKKLKNEGLDIDILEDHNQYFDQNKKRKELLEYTIDNYKPDFIFPIDADEFISCNSNKNPRDIIEKLDKNLLYSYKMINFIINDEDDEKELFVPKRMKYRRVESSNEGYTFKSFFPSNIYNKYFVMNMGCHSAYYEDGTKMNSKTINDLFLAHYPVRSKKQIMNKVIIGRLNNSSLHSRKEGHGFHQYKILDEIIKEGTLSNDTLYDISRNYGIKQDVANESNIIKEQNNTSFCKSIKIKYYEPKNSNLLSNTIKASETIIDKMRDKNTDLYTKYNNLYANYYNIEKQYESIINSKRWKLINGFCNIFKRKKK